MTYLWLRGPHRIMLALLLALYLAIAWTEWKVALPAAAVIIVALILRHNRRARNRQLGAASLVELYRLSPEHFEHRVMQILEANGWQRLIWVGKSGDMGADVTGIDPDGRYSIVQAKRYRPGTKIGSPVIQALIGSQQIHHAEHSVLVTTSSFTVDAMRLASHMGVDLIDGVGLVGMAQRGERMAA